MFNLEQSITEWRKQMLAAGIKSPVPLEELESHLREEIEERIKLGMSEQEAFEATVLQIGQANELKAEFSKERGWRDLLQGTMSKRARLVLFCWIGFCLIEFLSACGNYGPAATYLTSILLIISSATIAIAAYMAGIAWSIFLANHTKRVRGIIQVISNLGNLLLLIPMILVLHRLAHLHDWIHIIYIPFSFNLFTSVLLNSSAPAEPKKAIS